MRLSAATHARCYALARQDEYAELSVTGPAGVEVHVTGYYSPMFGGDGGDDGDDDDEDEEGGAGGGDAQIGRAHV